jgi:hypothetical protein
MQWAEEESEEEPNTRNSETHKPVIPEGLPQLLPHPSTDEDLQHRPRQDSPKRTKKLRTEKDTSSIRERTCSKMRHNAQ